MNKIFDTLFSFKFSVVLLAIYGVTMAAATFFEKSTSTVEVFRVFYHSWWFFCVQFLMCVNFIGVAAKMHLLRQRKWGVLMLHYGFVVILAGAMFTHVFSYEGIMHIREGETSSSLYIGKPQDGVMMELPFSVELEDFVLERYPGSSSPSSFESYVIIRHDGKTSREKIFMNNIAYVGQYRIYQTSYDRDELGTVLTVNKDLTGMIISYFGYIIMTLGFVFAMFHKGSRFRRMAVRLKELSAVKSIVVFTLLSVGFSSYAAGAYTPTDKLRQTLIADEVADSLASLLIQNPNGRVEPMNSYSEKMLRKLYRASSFEGIRAEKVIVGMFSDPYLWASTPMVYVGGNRELHKIIGTNSDYASYNDMFNSDGNYKLQPFLEKSYMKEAKEQNKFDKDLLKLDEKINIMNSLFGMQLLKIFPLKGSPADVWYSAGDDHSEFSGMDSIMVAKAIPLFVSANSEALDNGNWKNSLDLVSHMKIFQRAKASAEHLIPYKKISAEILYNKVNIFKVSGLSYLILGFLMLVLMFTVILRGKVANEKLFFGILFAAISAVFLYHTFGIALRWYISGRAPWTSSYETMVYVGWSALAAGFIFVKRSKVTYAVATMLAGIILMISQLNFLDPEITPLVPVLKSYWLMFHVAIITASYGFFAMSALLGLLVLLVMIFGRDTLKNKIEELNIINEMSVTLGLALLSVGVFIGAVWANESWGRYWGWDPKETWALITMIVYAFVIHARVFKPLRSGFAYAVMSLLSIYAVLMTFFGVNYYLSGMHSYGSSEGVNSTAIVAATAAVVVICVVAWIKERKRGNV